MAPDVSAPNIAQAKSALKAALELHAAHMNGTERTTDDSQRQLMEILEVAYKALGGPDRG